MVFMHILHRECLGMFCLWKAHKYLKYFEWFSSKQKRPKFWCFKPLECSVLCAGPNTWTVPPHWHLLNEWTWKTKIFWKETFLNDGEGRLLYFPLNPTWTDQILSWKGYRHYSVIWLSLNIFLPDSTRLFQPWGFKPNFQDGDVRRQRNNRSSLGLSVLPLGFQLLLEHQPAPLLRPAL